MYLDTGCQEQWLIGINGERESRESVLSAQLDDHDHLYLKPFVKIELISETFDQVTFCQGLCLLNL